MKSALIAILVVTFLLAVRPLQAGDFAWQPERTWAFVVGILEWKSPQYHGFPKENRRDERLVATLKQRGVPESQITYLQDRQATTAHVQEQFDSFLAKPRKGDWVFFYFTGHGFNSADHQETYLATYDAGQDPLGLPVTPIPRAINRRCRASYAILAVDNCNSGGMAHAVRNLKDPRVNFYALTSAHWNSSSTPHWTFTENLIYALSGEPFMDDDDDGVITFGELRANIVLDMTFAENQMPQFAKTEGFEPGWIVSKDRATPGPELGQRAEFLSSGHWYQGFTVARDGLKRKVRYYGWDVGHDQWVTPDRIRRPAPKHEYPVGQAVQALSSHEWYAGKVVDVRQGLHLIRFDGWDAEWNEWLPADKLKPR